MELTQITENIDHQHSLYYNYISIAHMKLRVLRFNLILTKQNAELLDIC